MTVSDEGRRAAREALQDHWRGAGPFDLRELIGRDPGRFADFSLEAAGIFLDYSKQRVDRDAMARLVALAQAAGVEDRRDAMLKGAKVNETEGRSVLHTALRRPLNAPLNLDGRDLMPDVAAVLGRMRDFAEAVRSGTQRGATGEVISDVVNIGIGGSDLGPRMVARALGGAPGPTPRLHFVSNVDGAALWDVLDRLNPARTLFLVTSKSFTTQETMANAQAARAWLQAALGEGAVRHHFAAISTNLNAVSAFGIDADKVFGFWSWVGGRFSLWSAVGLALAIGFGMDVFERLLAGAHAMDIHFSSAPIAVNMPVVLALLEYWNRNCLGAGSRAIVPYSERLGLLPSYLQQAEMESNGKRVRLSGEPVDWATAPVVWGGAGTDGQHAYFQLLHQGTDVIPVDFVGVIDPGHPLADQHRLLMANLFAQAHALAFGRTEEEVRQVLSAKGMPQAEAGRLVPHMVFPGNRPSSILLMDRLGPEELGALIALYEHKIFTLGVLWDVNSFDQFGVELGKVVATAMLEPPAALPKSGPPQSIVERYNSRVSEALRLTECSNSGIKTQ